jgi:hypothetical protein
MKLLDDTPDAKPVLLTLILISAESSAEDFKLLHSARLELQEVCVDVLCYVS